MSTQVSSAADEVAIAVQAPVAAAAGTVAGELAKMSPPPPLSSLVASLFGSVKNNENQPQIRSNAGCNNNNNNNNKRSLSNGSVNGANTSNGGTPRKLDKQQFGMCKICNDKATGIHYGIPSCEGCKVSLSGA